MSSRMPAVLSTADLPQAELRAAVLDGELYAIDECFSSIGELERPRHRAQALATLVPRGLIAEQRTAAWVYGAGDCPDRHQFCADITARVRPASLTRMAVREVVIGPGDVILIAGMAVTSPLRTAVDLARFSPGFADRERTIITTLLRTGNRSADDCIALLNRRRNIPGKRLAASRLLECAVRC